MTDQDSLAADPTDSAGVADQYYQCSHLGRSYTHEDPQLKVLFGEIADSLVSLFAPRTSYDAGCANGFLVRAMADRGVDARGGDISERAVESAPPGLVERLEVKDLVEPLEGTYDLISCIEVLEHMAAEDAQTALRNLCAATDLVVMSSAPDDFADPTHINVRPTAEWAKDFARHGLFRRTDVDARFISPWAVVFQRSRSTTVELVGAYESLLAPLTREVSAKRRALLQTRRDLDEALAPVNAAVGEVAGRLDEVIAERDYLLVERDLLQRQVEELGNADLVAERMRRLAMADEIIGLKAEIAQVRVHSENSVVQARRDAVQLQSDLTGARGVVSEITASTTWQLGRFAMLPVRMVRFLQRSLGAVSRRAAGRPHR